MSSTLEHDPRVIEQRAGLAGAIADYRRRIASGDIGQLPVIVGLVLIGAIFEYFSHGVFLSPFNLVNLTLQMAAGGTIAVGLVLILLLGEIDLAAGLTSGLGAAVMAVATTQWGLPAPAGVAVGLVCGAAVGAIQGGWLTRFTVPSFIVTLAGMSIWGGAALLVLGKTGTINLTDPFIVGIANTFFTGWQAYAWAALLLGYVVAGPLRERARRRAAGLTVPPAAGLTVRAVAVGAVVLGIVTILDADRGVSLGLVLLVGVVVGMDFLLRRTRFGRQVYAVGGNPQAAFLAGINVARIRVSVFVLGGLMAIHDARRSA